MINLSEKTPLGIVFPSGKPRMTVEEQNARVKDLENLGFIPKVFRPESVSADGFSAGTDAERAALLSQALTVRSYKHLWVARGGYGSTALIPHLKTMIPPILSDKVFFGFSDASFIGNILSLTYPNLTYVMGGHALEKEIFDPRSSPELKSDFELSLRILHGETPEPIRFHCKHSVLSNFNRNKLKEISGTLIPINLSLAESLASYKGIRLPRAPIFFFEDINEDVYRLLRKIDSLKLSGLLDCAEAIVLGDFTSCPDADGNEISMIRFANLINARTGLPTFVLPVFGHAERRLPLVAGSRTEITIGADGASIQIAFEKIYEKGQGQKIAIENSSFGNISRDNAGIRAHFLGIGGTGMAAVAGLAKQAGFRVSGSDGPIYPPMSHVLAALEITPIEGYSAESLELVEPDIVVVSNAISRVGANLSPNDEFEALLRSQIPIYSFPSFLRNCIFHNSINIVVAGTHGKTTTTSAVAFALREMGFDPSYLIGGSPKNFELGFHLGRNGVTVIEGDEYDTALFDKGPKFLHYEPRIALINNIEFDHADIYADLDSIVAEFNRLIQLTFANRGIVVANASDSNISQLIAKNSEVPFVLFADQSASKVRHYTDDLPTWLLLGHETQLDGSILRIQTPSGIEFSMKTRLFGKHNALNVAGALAALHAFQLTKEFESGVDAAKIKAVAHELSMSTIERWTDSLSTYEGVRRRFEPLHIDKNIAIFDDFAHHPTAIASTIEAFRDYHRVTERKGRLRVCFDPRNATMRRKVLEKDLTLSFCGADEVFIGKVAVDLRIPENERLNNQELAETLTKSGTPAHAYRTADELIAGLYSAVCPGDTVVFMSSGSFDGVPARFVENIRNKSTGVST